MRLNEHAAPSFAANCGAGTGTTMSRERVRNERVRNARRGVALMVVVVVLVILALMMSAIAWQMVAGRRELQHRQYELQAALLARAGIEHAAARLLERAQGYTGETLQPIARCIVTIEVFDEAGSDAVRVRSVARYPTDIVSVVVHTQTRLFRRVADGATVRLECLASNDE
jgi:type II secretory pathway pseudopilin PulG